MKIKEIFDEIAAESSTNQKMIILTKYKDNELLKRVLYLANSKRIKFYIKQIPEYPIHVGDIEFEMGLDSALEALSELYNRNITGLTAIRHLIHILSSVSPDDAYIIERIIDKDCKIGMGTTFINKVFPSLIEKTPYMGALPFDPILIKRMFASGCAVLSQKKLDGRYCNSLIRSGDVDLESRQGEITVLTGAKFIEELKGFEDCVINGELTMAGGINRYEANGIIASLVSIGNKK